MKNVVRVILIAVLVLTLAAGYASTSVLPGNDTEYDVSRMREDIRTISEEPHSTLLNKEALAEVREYIINELEEYGIETNVYTYKDVPTHKDKNVELNNIYAKIDGKDGENGSYILLACHYDSASSNPQANHGPSLNETDDKRKMLSISGWQTGELSYGAADDGYGVAAVLETARVMSKKKDSMINGIKLLFTDGEELWLIGSNEAVTKNPEIFDNVAYVVNLEARGTSGLAVLYELFGDTEKVLDLYRAGSGQAANSLVTSLYEGSSRSDYTNISKLGLPGINLTVLDEVENYHTPMDCYESLSDDSLKHFITQMLPITEEFTSDEKYSDVSYFKGEKKSNFFNILPGEIVDFSASWMYIITVVLSVLAVFILVKERKDLPDVLRLVRNRLLLLLCIAAVTFGISYILSLVTGSTYALAHMGKVSGDDILVIAGPVILFVIMVFMRFGSKYDTRKHQLAGLVIQEVLLLVVIFAVPGAAYLMAIPLMLSLIVFILGRYTGMTSAARYLHLVPVSVFFFLIAPMIFYLQLAFSIAALPMNCALLLLMYYYCQPVLYGCEK